MKKNGLKSLFTKGKRLLYLKLLIAALMIPSFSGAYPLIQKTEFNISIENTTLENALKTVRSTSGYYILFNLDDVRGVKNVTVKMDNANIREILDACLKNTGLTYTLEDRTIVVKKAQVTEQTRKAADYTVTGRVLDRKGDPVVGAAVIVRGTTTGASTGVDGQFSITVPALNSVLEISMLGKEKQEIVYTGQSSITVYLDEAVADVGEVIITGIFNKTRESNTGATRTITADELKRSSNRSVLTAIANIDPTFKIAYNIDAGSNPNTLPSITMRGSTSLPENIRELRSDSRIQNEKSANLPLFIKDGFEITLEQMMDIDENTVESITLLKDASATALYGTRGANGVIVLTTVKPIPGKLRVRYSADLAIEAPDLSSYNMMNAFEKLEFERRIGVYKHGNPSTQQALDELWSSRYGEAVRGVDTYWLNYPVRTGVGHKHRAEVEGGSEEFRFNVNIGFNDIEGAMKGSYRQTVNGGMTIMYKVKNLTFTNNLEVYKNNSQESHYGSFSAYANMNPYYTPYDDNGNVKRYLEYSQYYANNFTSGYVTVNNPLWNANLPSRDESKYTSIHNNFALQWDILPGLFARATLGYTDRKTRKDVYLSKDHSSFMNVPVDRRGTYSQEYEESVSFETTMTMNYNKTFNNDHNLFAGVGYNAYQYKSELYIFDAEGISNPDMDFISMASAYAKDGSPFGIDQISRRLGGVANVNYSYKRKYYADLNGNLEGSSQFGANNRTAPFWSAGVGWNIHEENFLDSRVLTYAKLRVSYGTSGSQDFNPYQALMTYKDYGSINYGGWSGVYLLALGNEDLGWQKTRQLNLGAEVEFWNNRLQMILNLYNKTTDDLLTDITIPGSGGFSSYVANVGKVQNRGFELNLNGSVIRDTSREIIWQMGVNLNYNKNTIKKISNSLDFLNQQLISESQTTTNPSFLFEEGHSYNTIYAVKSLGIDPSNGKEVFLKKDGTITYDWDHSDMVACGVEEPKFWGNISTLVRYKRLAFNAVFRFAWGGQMYNKTLAGKVENINHYYNLDKRALTDRWYRPGDKTYFKRIDDSSTTRATSRFVMDDNYITLNSMSLTYDFTQPWVKNLGMESMTLGAFTEEMFTAASIKQERGINYPFSRKFSMKLTLRF